MSTLVRTVTKTSRIKCLGMCHELFGLFMHLSKLLKLGDWKKMQALVGGINHFSWATQLYYDGRDVMALLRNHIKNHGTKGDLQVKLELFKLYGVIPIAGDRHVVEFMPHFCNSRTNAGADFGVKLTTIEDRYKLFKKAKQKAADMISGKKKISMTKSYERVSNIIAALAGGKKEIDIINIPNKGQIDNLPRDAVVEIMGLIDWRDASGLSMGTLPRPLEGLLNLHIQKQEMTVEAALTGDRKLALQAMLLDPLVQDWNAAGKMLDALVF